MDAERTWKRYARAACIALVTALCAAGSVRAQDAGATPQAPSERRAVATTGTLVDDRPASGVKAALPDIDLQSRLKDVVITTTPQGDVVQVPTERGTVELSAAEYVRALAATKARVEHGGFFYRIFNISKPWSFVWISVGLLGQVMFTFRMVLQWLASEKHKRSIVPVGFWWGSLIGGAMLFAYFCWRKDVVGIIGQSSGVFIYARNLVLIYRGKRIEAEGARPVDGDDDDEPIQKSVATPHAT